MGAILVTLNPAYRVNELVSVLVWPEHGAWHVTKLNVDHLPPHGAILGEHPKHGGRVAPLCRPTSSKLAVHTHAVRYPPGFTLLYPGEHTVRGTPRAATPRRREQFDGCELIPRRNRGYQVHRGLAGDARVEGGLRGTATCP